MMKNSKEDRGSALGPLLAPAQVQRLSALPQLLLSWYDCAARDLPWRHNATPYRVWISEMMLQQTRVEAAKSYFQRFVAALPDVYALAAVEEDVLLKLWEGLGYYSRAKNLKRAAQQLVSQYDGVLPADPALLRTLPGIGEYSSGSIASIAFEWRAPAVDGNVLRVISRLLASEADVTRASVKRELTALVAALLPNERIGDFNQSLMELGAIVCLPNGAPLCASCPLQSLCAGYAQGIAAQLPIKTAKKPRRVQQITALLLTKEKTLYLRKRAEHGLLAGLWELPNVEQALTAEQVTAWLVELGLGETAETITPAPALAATGKHIFTHVEWQIKLYTLALPKEALLPADWVQVSQEDLAERYPLPSAFLFLLKKL